MKKILILYPYPFIKRDYERFGIEILKKSFDVKVLNLVPWLRPDIWKKYSDTIFNFKEYFTVTSKEDFIDFIKGSDFNIIFDLMYADSKTNWIRRRLKTDKNFFVNIEVNAIPEPKIHIVENIKKVLKFQMSPIKILKKVLFFLKKKYYNFKKIKSDISINGGLFSLKNSKAKIKIQAHTMDYDIYLENINKKNKKEEKNYAVFIDEGPFYNPDSDIFYPVPFKEDEYFLTLLDFFRKFKNETNLDILFAVHPKTSPKNLKKCSNYLKEIKCVIGNTAELVKDSKVVLTHESTALSYAILFNKPLIFITSDEINDSWMKPHIDAFNKIINSHVINISKKKTEPLNTEKLFKIDKNGYNKYLYDFLKIPNSPNLPLWEIFSQEIKKLP